MQLADIQPHTMIIVDSIPLSADVKDKLLNLGIIKGVELLVLQNIVGNIVVLNGESRISLGKQITSKIEVKNA